MSLTARFRVSSAPRGVSTPPSAIPTPAVSGPVNCCLAVTQAGQQRGRGTPARPAACFYPVRLPHRPRGEWCGVSGPCLEACKPSTRFRFRLDVGLVSPDACVTVRRLSKRDQAGEVATGRSWRGLVALSQLLRHLEVVRPRVRVQASSTMPPCRRRARQWPWTCPRSQYYH